MSSNSISVIIVTYNSEGFIPFCLDSILSSSVAQHIEVIVIDNDSADQTVDLIKSNYPQVLLVTNEQNVGFGRACNQGAALSKGESLLFLNPDCIVDHKAIEILYQTSIGKSRGMAGPVLLDGQGRTLPESARKRLTVSGAIFKLLGLSSGGLFPYYQPIDGAGENHVDVLSGACVMIGRETFEKVGGFDEDYFMYGEDIQLSDDVRSLGLTNTCNPAASVLHFKGESTDKTSWLYNFSFYNAIHIYFKKRYVNKVNGFASSLSNLFLSFLSIVGLLIRGMKTVIPILFDVLCLSLVIWLCAAIWSSWEYGSFNYFNWYQYGLYIFLYALIWRSMLYLSGGLPIKENSWRNIAKGNMYAFFAVLIFYSLLPEMLRFSRMVIVLSAIAIAFLLYVKYVILKRASSLEVFVLTRRDLSQSKLFKRLPRAFTQMNRSEDLGQSKEKRGRIIIDTNSLHTKEIFEILKICGLNNRISIEFWHEKLDILFSSRSPKSRGLKETQLSHYHLSKSHFKMQKRIFDLIILILLLVPVFFCKLLLSKWRMGNLKDLFRGKLTLVGYDVGLLTYGPLPKVPRALFASYSEKLPKMEQFRIAKEYCGQYSILDDGIVVLSNIPQLIRKLTE